MVTTPACYGEVRVASPLQVVTQTPGGDVEVKAEDWACCTDSSNPPYASLVAIQALGLVVCFVSSVGTRLGQVPMLDRSSSIQLSLVRFTLCIYSYRSGIT